MCGLRLPRLAWIELAQNWQSRSALSLQAAFADINIGKSWSVYY